MYTREIDNGNITSAVTSALELYARFECRRLRLNTCKRIQRSHWAWSDCLYNQPVSQSVEFARCKITEKNRVPNLQQQKLFG